MADQRETTKAEGLDLLDRLETACGTLDEGKSLVTDFLSHIATRKRSLFGNDSKLPQLMVLTAAEQAVLAVAKADDEALKRQVLQAARVLINQAK